VCGITTADRRIAEAERQELRRLCSLLELVPGEVWRVLESAET
jgi:hypothetical protein